MIGKWNKVECSKNLVQLAIKNNVGGNIEERLSNDKNIEVVYQMIFLSLFLEDNIWTKQLDEWTNAAIGTNLWHHTRTTQIYYIKA